jgi:type III restriction enzyme
VTIGRTRTFYPDFLVWNGDAVLAIDTKAGPTLPDGASRKLMYILTPKGTHDRLIIRFVSKGRWNDKLQEESPDGFTVWGRKPTGELRTIHLPTLDAVMPVVLDPDVD